MTRNTEDFFYQTGHQPTPEGAPLHDLTGNGEVYPGDVYSDKGNRYYGGPGQEASYNKAVSYRGKPDAPVTIYRAVPKHVSSINPGDWVTLDRSYAKGHGEAHLGGKPYKILSMTVPARHVRTPGDSFNEWGYYPND